MGDVWSAPQANNLAGKVYGVPPLRVSRVNNQDGHWSILTLLICLVGQEGHSENSGGKF